MIQPVMLPVAVPVVPASPVPDVAAVDASEESFAAMLQVAGMLAPPPPVPRPVSPSPALPQPSLAPGDATLSGPVAASVPTRSDKGDTIARPALSTASRSPGSMATALDAGTAAVMEITPRAATPPETQVAPSASAPVVVPGTPPEVAASASSLGQALHGMEQLREAIAPGLRVQRGRGLTVPAGKAMRLAIGDAAVPVVGLSPSQASDGASISVDAVAAGVGKDRNADLPAPETSETVGDDAAAPSGSGRGSGEGTEPMVTVANEPEPPPMSSLLATQGSVPARSGAHTPPAGPAAPRAPIEQPPENPATSRLVVVPFDTVDGEASRVRIALVGDSVRATIMTSAAAAPALDAALPELRQALTDRGFSDSHVVVRATGVEAAAAAAPRGDSGTPTGTDRRSPEHQDGHEAEGRRQDRDTPGRHRRQESHEESA